MSCVELIIERMTIQMFKLVNCEPMQNSYKQNIKHIEGEIRNEGSGKAELVDVIAVPRIEAIP